MFLTQRNCKNLYTKEGDFSLCSKCPPFLLSPRTKWGVSHFSLSLPQGDFSLRSKRQGKDVPLTPFYCLPERKPRGPIPSASLMAYEGSPFFLCCNLFFSAYNYLKRAKAVEISATKLEKELQEIKALLLQLLKHDEHSKLKKRNKRYNEVNF